MYKKVCEKGKIGGFFTIPFLSPYFHPLPPFFSSFSTFTPLIITLSWGESLHFHPVSPYCHLFPSNDPKFHSSVTLKSLFALVNQQKMTLYHIFHPCFISGFTLFSLIDPSIFAYWKMVKLMKSNEVKKEIHLGKLEIVL